MPYDINPKGFKRLKRLWEENPEQMIMLGIGGLTASALFINAVANAAGRNTWRQEVKRRKRLNDQQYPQYSRYPYSRRG